MLFTIISIAVIFANMYFTLAELQGRSTDPPNIRPFLLFPPDFWLNTAVFPYIKF